MLSWDFPEEISGDCCGSRTMFGVQSDELCDRWRFDGRLVLRESEGRRSGREGVVGGVENVSLSGDSIVVGPRSVGVRMQRFTAPERADLRFM